MEKILLHNKCFYFYILKVHFKYILLLTIVISIATSATSDHSSYEANIIKNAFELIKTASVSYTMKRSRLLVSSCSSGNSRNNNVDNKVCDLVHAYIFLCLKSKTSNIYVRVLGNWMGSV